MNGPRTGTRYTVREHRPIPPDRHRAPPVLFGAGLGTLRARTCVRPAASTPPEHSLQLIGFRVGFKQVQPDRASPELVLSGGVEVTHVAGQAWAEPGVAAHDVRDGDLSGRVSIAGLVDVNTTGLYVLTYTVSDTAGNLATANRKVRVTPPAPTTATYLVPTAANLEMIWVADGNFTMGSPTTEPGRSTTTDRETEHNVTLTQGFYLGKYEVTQAQYAVVMSGNTNNLNPSPSNWPNNPNRPVEKVSWDDVQIFLTRLNASEQAAGRLPSGWSYVLPTESQWEYACRAGTTTAYSWGTTIATSRCKLESWK